MKERDSSGSCICHAGSDICKSPFNLSRERVKFLLGLLEGLAFLDGVTSTHARTDG